MNMIAIIILIFTLTGAFATPNNESGWMSEHSASIALINNQPEQNALTGAFRWVRSETARTIFGLLDIRNVVKNLLNGISYFIRVIANGEGFAYQRQLPDRETHDYEAIIDMIIADHEKEFGPLPDGYLYPTESVMEPYIASHQDSLPAVFAHPDVPAAQFASPEIGSSCFMRPAIYLAAVLLIVIGVLILVRCAATSCLKIPVGDEFSMGPVEVDLNGADPDQHDVSCVETTNCESSHGPGLQSDALYDAKLALELEEAEMDRQAKFEIPIPEEYESFPVPFTPQSVDKNQERKPCLRKSKPKANPFEYDARIKELAPGFDRENPEFWVESFLGKLKNLPEQLQTTNRTYKSNKRLIKNTMELVKDYNNFLFSCFAHVHRLKDNLMQIAPIEKETRSEGRRSIGKKFEAMEECLKWIDEELTPDIRKLVEDMEQVRSHRSRIFGISKRDDSMSYEDLTESVAQRIECFIASRDPSALTVLIRISEIMEDMLDFAQILEYELRNPLRNISINDKLAICPVYSNKDMQRLLSLVDYE